MTYKNHLCPECGTDPSDWLDEGGRRIMPPPFLAQTIRCYGCVETRMEMKVSGKQDSKGGLHTRLILNTEGVIP